MSTLWSRIWKSRSWSSWSVSHRLLSDMRAGCAWGHWGWVHGWTQSQFLVFFLVASYSPSAYPSEWTRRASWRLVETSTYFTEFLANTVQKAQIMRRGKDHNEQDTDTSKLRVNCQNLMFTIFLLNLSINLKFFLLH